jgi:hypothetical protein
VSERVALPLREKISMVAAAVRTRMLMELCGISVDEQPRLWPRQTKYPIPHSPVI